MSPELIEEVESAAQAADVEYLVEEIPAAIRQSLEGVERVAKIVRAMKEFSHPGVEEKTPIDLNKSIESTITVARNEWKYVADMETDCDPNLPLVTCLPSDLNQVFLNMIVNSAHAIADVVGDGSNGKGTIRISTRHLKGWGASGLDWVEVRISDTGTGIPKDVISKIFDPFFTTKEVGKGYPRGLAGEDVPLTSRIVAIADVYDALRSERSYKPALSEFDTLGIMREEVGRHFDPQIYEKSLDEFRSIRSQFVDEISAEAQIQ